MELKQAQIEISREIENYKKKLGIDRPLKVKFTGNPAFGGAYRKNCISVYKGAVKRWEDIPDNVRFVIIHELVHAKYYDEGSFTRSTTSLFWPPLSLKLAFRELRANTIAHQVLGANQFLLDHYFKNTYWNKGVSYLDMSGGYLRPKEYIELITHNPEWNHRAIDAAKDHFKKRLNFLFLPKVIINHIAKPFESELMK